MTASPLSLPALTRALKLQNRAARVGFDWPSTDQVLDKLVEEAREVVEARDTLTHDALTEEIGDLLFVMANLARHLKVDPEAALRAANAEIHPPLCPDRGLAGRGPAAHPPTATWPKWTPSGTAPRPRTSRRADCLNIPAGGSDAAAPRPGQ